MASFGKIERLAQVCRLGETIIAATAPCADSVTPHVFDLSR